MVGALVFFAFAVLLTRLLGKRTTAQMHNFDWIIAVAMGSLLSSGILLKDVPVPVPVPDALVAMAVLGLCQWLTTWLVIRVPGLARVVEPVPRPLVHDGELVEDALRAERISKDELFARLHAHGYTHLAEGQWVIRNGRYDDGHSGHGSRNAALRCGAWEKHQRCGASQDHTTRRCVTLNRHASPEPATERKSLLLSWHGVGCRDAY